MIFLFPLGCFECVVAEFSLSFLFDAHVVFSLFLPFFLFFFLGLFENDINFFFTFTVLFVVLVSV